MREKERKNKEVGTAERFPPDFINEQKEVRNEAYFNSKIAKDRLKSGMIS